MKYVKVGSVEVAVFFVLVMRYSTLVVYFIVLQSEALYYAHTRLSELSRCNISMGPVHDSLRRVK
jgi:hypothetical protein